MRKMFSLLLIILAAGMLNALPKFIIGIPASELSLSKEENSLRNKVKELSAQDLEIYYYNEFYIIAGTNVSNYPKAVNLGTPQDGRFYLVTIGNRHPDFDRNIVGEVLLKMGSVVLLKTDLDEIQLRQQIIYPFIPLLYEPIKIADYSTLNNSLKHTRTDIVDMIADVSVDSVAYFIQSLQDFMTRYALANNRLEVANWIKAQFERFGITDSQLYPFNWSGTTQYNVVATIPGTIYPDTYIIVGGHHDSITNDNPMTFAPGADDNASGTVAALEMARVMMANNYQPKCSIRFVTFAAEEFGLWGSKAYATMADQNNLDIRLMINHDMIANISPNPWDSRVFLMPYDGYLDLTEYAAMLTSQYTTLLPVYGSMNLSASDSYSFWQHGFPVVYFFEYNFSDVYHSNNDIVANLDPFYCTKVIRASTAVAVSFADMPSTPTNFTVQDEGTGSSIHLSWNPVSDPTLSHYKISWGITQDTLSDSQTTIQNEISINNLTTGQLYHFALTAVDDNDNESMPIFNQAVPRLIPSVPVSFTDHPLPQVVELVWQANTELDLAGYKLYRSLDSSEIGELIATLPPTGQSFTDTNVQGGDFYYYYRLCAFDNDNNNSPYTAVIKTRPINMNYGVLIVDETMDFSGSNLFQPTDEQVDSFYDQLVAGLWSTSHFDLATLTDTLRLCDLGIYSAIIWHGNDYTDMQYPYYIKDALKSYIYYGGKVLFSLYHPSMAFEMNSGYPASFPSGSFINEVLGISNVDYSTSARFNKAVSTDPNYIEVNVDPAKVPPGLNGHLFHIEVINPNAQATPIYSYASAYDHNTLQGVLNGGVVGILNNYYAGKTVTLSFPLYSMDFNQSRQVLRYIVETCFEQPISVSDEVINQVPEISILPNQPNPFSSTTQFNILCKNISAPLEVKIYNLKGQLVKTLYKGIADSKNNISWDGTDYKDKQTASGIYLIKANQGNTIETRKILKLK